MKQTTLFIFCLLAMAFGAESAASQVTRADYERADTILKCSDRVYSPAIHPEWIDSSHYFWYKNHEKEGDFYYLVNAESGKKQRAADKKGLAAFFSKKQKKLAESLLKEEEKRPDRWRRREEAPVPVVSPDKKWEAYVKDNNLYLSPLWDEKEKDKPKEEIALTMDGTANLRYDGWSIIWSPDSRKLATVKVRDVQERRIPLIESSPSSQKQPILQWRNYAKPGDVLPVYLPVLFDVEARKQMALNVTPYENQFYLNLTGWREDSRAFTFEFNQRGHQRYVIGEVSAADGSIRHLVDEQTKTFIYYYNNYRYDLDDGKELLWISERDGWRHLYLIDGTSGQVKRQVTKGEWVLRQVDYVDETNRVVYFTASGFNKGEDPYNLHYCRINLDGTGFTDMTPENGNHRVTFSADRMVRILFVMSGALMIEHGETMCLVTSRQYVCLARGERFVATAQDEANIVVLSLIHRIEFCEQDIFDKVMPYDTVIPNEDVPKLAMHPSIERLLEGLFMIPEMSGCSRYHKMKATELFMMIKVLYTPTEHAYFFQSMIQPQDNFRVFVCNNYDKAQGVAELASLAGMSLSVFKRRFDEHFNDSVYHWMMRQKALKIFSDIRDGEDSTKALMNKYGFRHYTQFSRFCKNYLQATPAQLIASIKEG